MAHFKVIVPKLRVRNKPVEDTSDMASRVTIVNEGFEIDLELKEINKLGKWYVDNKGQFYSEKGLMEMGGGQQQVSPIVNYNRIIADIPDSWRITEGKGVKVVIMDSGVSNNHQDLKLLQSNYLDFYYKGTDKFDKYGHGTKVAGIIGGNTSTNGIIGIASKCELISYKTTKNSGATDSSVFLNSLPTLSLLAQNNRVVVVNCSFDISPDTKIDTAIAGMPSNVIFVCAAGNDEGLLSSANSIFYPASHPNTIGIGFIKEDSLSSIMSKGSFDNNLDFIYVGNEQMSCSIPNADSYSKFNSCSMATALVSGIATLVASHFLNTSTSINATAIKQALQAAFKDITAFSTNKNLLSIYKK